MMVRDKPWRRRISWTNNIASPSASSRGTGDQVSLLGEAVDNKPQPSYSGSPVTESMEMSCHGQSRNRQGLGNTVGGMAGALGPLVGETSPEVMLDVLSHPRPKIFAAQEVTGLGAARWPIAGESCGLEGAGDEVRDVGTALVTEPAVVLVGYSRPGRCLCRADASATQNLRGMGRLRNQM